MQMHTARQGKDAGAHCTPGYGCMSTLHARTWMQEHTARQGMDAGARSTPGHGCRSTLHARALVPPNIFSPCIGLSDIWRHVQQRAIAPAPDDTMHTNLINKYSGHQPGNDSARNKGTVSYRNMKAHEKIKNTYLNLAIVDNGKFDTYLQKKKNK